LAHPPYRRQTRKISRIIVQNQIVKALGDEWATFLAANPAIESVDFLFVDLCGTIRGKRYPVAEAGKVFDGGLQIPYTLYLLDARGETTDATGRGYGDGDPDGTAWPVPGTLHRAACSPRAHAQVLMSVKDEKGQPYFAEPRNVLNRVVEAYAPIGLRPVIAAELEFFVMDPERLASGSPQPPLIPGTAIRENAISVYGIDDLDRYQAFLDDVMAGAKLQKVPATTASSEHAPGQFEINLHHQDDAVAAADHATFLKQIIRNAAKLHRMAASFMAKPYLNAPGSGLHIHISVQDAQGRNIFDDGTPQGSAALRYAAGGLQTIMGEAMAVFAPNVNSYRRFVPNAFTPMNRRWGYNNRSTGIRIPAGPNHGRRLEHRVSGADANPYLAIAAVLAGIHHGLSERVEPGAPFEGNAAGFTDATVPFNIDAALAAMESGPVIGRYFTPAYVDVYCGAKRVELARFRNNIPKAEYDWYL
jgi:glutamine synthetase